MTIEINDDGTALEIKVEETKLEITEGLNAAQVRDIAEDAVSDGTEEWSQDGNTDQIPADKLLLAPTGGGGGGGGGLSAAQVDARIAPFARTSNTDDVPEPKIPDEIARDTEVTAAVVARYTDAEKAKLGGIEASATADQTGTEIATAIDTAIGTAWRTGGGGTGNTTVYVQATEPSGGTYATDDVWVETVTLLRIHKYDGSDWVLTYTLPSLEDLGVDLLARGGTLPVATKELYDTHEVAARDGVWFYVVETGHGTENVWTWHNLTTADLAKWRGVVEQNPFTITNPQPLDWAYIKNEHRWVRYASSTWEYQSAPANFDSRYRSENAAERAGLVTVGKFIYSNALNHMRVIRQYAGNVPVLPTYAWVAFDTGSKQTGSEIVDAIDTELGSEDWQSGGGSGGLTEAQVDARVAAGVADFAEEGNTADLVPDSKIAGNIARTVQVPTIAQIDARARARYTDAEKAKLAAVEASATADQTGTEIVDAIDTELGSEDWQSGGGSGGGTDDQTAAEVPVDATGFGVSLHTGDDNVQAALDRINDFELENSFRGAYNSNRTYDGGEMVIFAGLEYISLIRQNSRAPTRSEEQWSAQPRGYIYRGDAPVAATTYQESHFVRVPAQDSWYICTFQGGVLVTRAEIAAGHMNFAPLAHRLTDTESLNRLSTIRGLISGRQLDTFAPALGIAEATDKTSDKFGRVSGRRIGEAIDAHVVPSSHATTDVGEDSVIGTSVEFSRDDHAHELPIDSTLEFTASGDLAVNVHDVIETLQERIRYFTFAITTSDAGASVGEVFTTSEYRKTITKVDVTFAPSSGSDSFLVRLVELNSDNSIKAKLFTSATRPQSEFGTNLATHHFLFHNAAGEPGVTVDAGIRLGVLLSRLGDDSDSAVHAIHGSESADSPDITYDDAEADFDFVNSVVYNHIDPAVGASTHSHDSQIRGNIKIYYKLIIDHGRFVGDGNVRPSDIDSGSAAVGEVLTADGSGSTMFAPPSGGAGAASPLGRTQVLSSELDAGTQTPVAMTSTADIEADGLYQWVARGDTDQAWGQLFYGAELTELPEFTTAPTNDEGARLFSISKGESNLSSHGVGNLRIWRRAANNTDFWVQKSRTEYLEFFIYKIDLPAGGGGGTPSGGGGGGTVLEILTGTNLDSFPDPLPEIPAGENGTVWFRVENNTTPATLSAEFVLCSIETWRKARDYATRSDPDHTGTYTQYIYPGHARILSNETVTENDSWPRINFLHKGANHADVTERGRLQVSYTGTNTPGGILTLYATY